MTTLFSVRLRNRERACGAVYGKCGWELAGTVVNPLDTPAGIIRREVWRYEKRLTRAV